MEITGRMFPCHRCRVQVTVCAPCDRGQIYCARGCAEAARTASMREAGRRYQQSRKGRFKHSERNRRYRLRQQNVTHQGSMPPAQSDLLVANSVLGREPVVATESPTPLGARRCHFCGNRCPEWVRLDFLHSSRVPSAVGSKRRGAHFDPSP